MRPTELTIKELRILADMPQGITLTLFSERLFIDRPGPGSRRSAGTALAKLEKAGLVKLLYEARRWVYRITPDGITFLNDNRRSGQPPDAS